MEIKALRAEIFSNTIPNFLIFEAIEPALAKQYIDRISDTLSMKKSYYDTADGALYDITAGLKDDCLYIITDDDKVLKNEKYVENIISLNKHVIVMFSSIDRKTYSSFVKSFDKYIVVFDKLDELSLLRYAEKKCQEKSITVDQDKLLSIVRYSDNSLGCLLNELDKIFTLEQQNSNMLVDYMLNNGFSDYRRTDTDKLIQKVCNKEKDVYEYYMRFNDTNESCAMIFYKLYSEARSRFIRSKDRYFSKMLLLCSEMYNGIVDGSVAEEYAFKYFLLKLGED